MLHLAHASSPSRTFFFFFNDTATTEIYTLSLHDALPICQVAQKEEVGRDAGVDTGVRGIVRLSEDMGQREQRSEEHTSELQSRENLVCRLLLEKKKKKKQEEAPQSYSTRQISHETSSRQP